MTPAILVLAMLSQPECRMTRDQAEQLAPIILAEERRWQLPNGLLAATVLAESGGRNIVVRHRHGCDTGPGQVFIPKCNSRMVWLLRRPRVSLTVAASILDWSRARCLADHRGPCKRSVFAHYNAGSRGWWRRVERIWRRLQHAAEPTS